MIATSMGEPPHDDYLLLSMRMLQAFCLLLQRTEASDGEEIHLDFLACDSAGRSFFVVVTTRSARLATLMQLLGDPRIRTLAEAGADFDLHVWSGRECDVIQLSLKDFAP